MIDKNVDYGSPSLWIEKFIIYRSLDPVDIMRTIKFKRGLNLVWGVAQEVEEPEGSRAILTGHSVGKTTLCRLLRYGLGENTFGRRSVMAAIKHTFPNAYIGMIVNLQDQKWSVLKPIGINGDPLAGENITIEELFNKPSEQFSYKSFLNELEEEFIRPLPVQSFPGTELPYKWEHLLAWMTRDQEARYQNLWDWRSKRSQAQISPYKKPKEDVLVLMRMILNLLDVEDAKAAKQLEDYQEELKALEQDINEKSKEPEFRFSYQNDLILQILPERFRPEENAENDLFGLDSQISSYKSFLEGEVKGAKEKRLKLENLIISAKAEHNKYYDQLKKVLAGISTVSEGTETETDEDELSNLLNAQKRKCTYGQIKFDQCEHFNIHIKKLHKEFIDFKAANEDSWAQQSADERQKAIEEWLANEMKLNEVLAKLGDRIKGLQYKIENCDNYIITKSSTLERLNYHGAQRRDAQDLLDGKKKNTELNDLQKKVKTCKGNISSKETELKTIQGRLLDRGHKLQKLYDDILKAVLATSYSGKVQIPPKELSFGIEETGSGLAGEAVESLSLVLADITAMLWTVLGQGSHPRFLLHDSPREADLDHNVYNSFLSSVHELSQGWKGLEAPFQYIITTTSKPPKSLHEDDTIRLQLEAHPEEKLLFKQILSRVPHEGELWHE